MRTIFTFALTIILSSSAFSQKIMPYNQKVFDFGHVGVDFTVKHKYFFYNESNDTIKILDIDETCDCTLVRHNDSLIYPGDTAYFDLTFYTKDYYGPTNKTFHIITDHPDYKEITFHYLSIVGQWYNGLKPNPVSLFFLPGKGPQKIDIYNSKYDYIEVAELIKYSDNFDVKILKDKVEAKNVIELEITPKSDIPKGTNFSTLTVFVKRAGIDKLSPLTIPIKIVKY